MSTSQVDSITKAELEQRELDGTVGVAPQEAACLEDSIEDRKGERERREGGRGRKDKWQINYNRMLRGCIS